MLSYFVLFFLLLTSGFIYERVSNESKFLIYAFSFFIFFLLIGFKFNVGTDSGNYLRVFNGIKEYEGVFLKFPEVGYYLLNNLAAYLGMGMQFVYFFCGLIITYFTFQSAKILNLNPLYFVAIIYPFHIVMISVSGIRQGVAESIFIYGFSLIILNKRFKYLMCLLSAFSFHSSAIFFSFLGIINKKKRYILLLFLVLVPFSVYFASDKYGHYITSSLYSSGIYLRVGFLFVLSILLISNIWFLKIKISNPILLRLIIAFSFSPIILSIASPLSTTLMDRISYYFIMGETLLFFVLLKDYTDKSLVKFSVFVLILASFISLFAFSFFGNNATNYQYHNYIIHLLS